MEKILYNNKLRTSASKYIFTCGLICLLSCTKLVEVDPPITSNNGELVFRDDATSIAALTGIYSNMSNAGVADVNGWLTNVFFLTGLTGDELTLVDEDEQTFGPYYKNSLSKPMNSWANIYRMIFTANSAIEELPKASTLTPNVKNQLLGEAMFIRAFCNFYLVNLYGGIPLATTTDYKINQNLPRTNVENVYVQIIKDLKTAQNLLTDKYVGKDVTSITQERVRPNKWTASALLARVYLYTESYSDAEREATSVIDNPLFHLVELNDVFTMNNLEAIWQLQPVGISSRNSANTREGQILKILPNNNNPIVSLSNDLLINFDDKDQRKVNWIGTVKVSGGNIYNYSNKYKQGYEPSPTTEYSTVLRLGEQYLIRAEARIHRGRVSEGIKDLNILRTRASLSTPGFELSRLSEDLSQNAAILAVENERRFELFTEWGHRWFDLKRTNRVDIVLSLFKGSLWQTADKLFPIPDADDRFGRPQNPGYN